MMAHPSIITNVFISSTCHCEPGALDPMTFKAKGAAIRLGVVARAKPVAISRVPSLCSGQGFFVSLIAMTSYLMRLC